MKIALLIMLSVLLFGCTPLSNGGGTAGPKIKGKVIRITCASTAIQILDAASFSLGDTWVKGSDTIEHAAYVINKCEFPDNLTAGNEFYFRVITAAQARNDCAVCMLYDFPPSKGIYLKVVN
ncbi:MAG: hypothetical protein JWN78_2375 [Bacteroidota bacterium]|nr:hypothetical protein [Bacteroidota bacterium]